MVEMLMIIGMSLLITFVVLAGIYCGGILGASITKMFTE